MKKIYNLLVLAAFAVAAGACTDPEENTDTAAPATGNLQFITRAPRSVSVGGPVHGIGEYRILAF